MHVYSYSFLLLHSPPSWYLDDSMRACGCDICALGEVCVLADDDGIGMMAIFILMYL